MRIYSHLLNKQLTEKIHFLHWFVLVRRQKSTVKKKKTYFLKKYVASLFTFSKKVFAIFKFFTAWYLNERFWNFLYFICLKFDPQDRYFLFAGRKCVHLAVLFNERREETFAVSLQNRKSCVYINYLPLFRPQKLISVNFALLYSM